MKKFNKGLVACTVAAALAAPMTAMATNGYFSHGYGTKSKGMAGAGVATSQSSMSTATNPALMQAQAGRIDFGIEYFQPNRTGTTRSDNTSYTGDGDASFLIPEFGYSSKIGSDKSWGIVVYGNGGMNTRYSSIAQYNGGNGKDVGMNMEQLFIAPTFAMDINDKSSFGVSLNLIYQTFEAYGLEGFAGFTSNSATTTYLTGMGKDDSTGFSVKLGYQADVTDQLSLGIAYQTKSDMSKFSQYKELFAEGGGFDIPSNWTVGLTFKATPKVNVLFDIQKINYSDVASIANENNNTMGVLGADNGRGFGWEDMTIYKLGADFAVNDTLVVRAGYSTGTQPIGADDTAFNLIAPAVIEDHITLGATWTLKDKSELSAYLMKALENEVIGNSTTPGTSGAADIKMDQTALGVAYGWKF